MSFGGETEIEEAFLVHKSGCLLGYHTQEANVQVDYDIVAGMLTAIQSFVKDTFGEGRWGLKNLEFENKNIMIELGDNFYLALVYSGRATNKMKSKVEAIMVAMSLSDTPGLICPDSCRAFLAFMAAVYPPTERCVLKACAAAMLVNRCSGIPASRPAARTCWFMAAEVPSGVSN